MLFSVCSRARSMHSTLSRQNSPSSSSTSSSSTSSSTSSSSSAAPPSTPAPAVAAKKVPPPAVAIPAKRPVALNTLTASAAAKIPILQIPTAAPRAPQKVPVKSAAPRRAASTYTPPRPTDPAAEIAFERPDSELSIPPNVDTKSFLFFNYLKTATPKWRFAVVDFFFAAVELFVHSLRHEYEQHRQRSLRNNKPDAKFSWKNDSGMAENFAAALDQTQSLHESLSSNQSLRGRLLPFKDFAGAAMTFFRVESGLSEVVLGEKTYYVKFKDWQAGGTRYDGGEIKDDRRDYQKTNVLFATVSQRRDKIRRFLLSQLPAAAAAGGGSGESQQQQQPAKLAFELAMESSSTRVSIMDGSSIPGRPKIAPTIRIRRTSAAPAAAGDERGTARLPSLINKPVSDDEKADQLIRVTLHRLFGTSWTVLDRQKANIGEFVKLCGDARSTGMRLYLLEMIQKSSEAVQSAFNRAGGMKAVWLYFRDAMLQGNQNAFMKLLEYLAELRCKFSSDTRTQWAMHPTVEARNTEAEISARLTPASPGERPPILAWMREYIQQPVPGAERRTPLDGPYIRNLIDRFERQLAGEAKRALFPPPRWPDAKAGPRSEAAVAPSSFTEQATRSDLLRVMTERVVSRSSSSAVQRLDGIGPIISAERGDFSINPAPSDFVNCLCVQCVGSETTVVGFNPYQLLGIKEPD